MSSGPLLLHARARCARSQQALPRRLGYREKVTLAEVGVAPAFELLVVAAERVLLGEIGQDPLIRRRIDHGQDLDLLLLEAGKCRADVLIRQQVEIAVRGELTREAA